MGTLFYLSPPPALSDAWSFPARRPISGGTRSCPWSLGRDLPAAQTSIPGNGWGVLEGSRPTAGPCARQPGSQASVTPFLLAPVGIGNRKKQAGKGAQQLWPERPAPPTPRAFLICFLEGGTCWGMEGGQAGPSPGLKTGLWARELEVRGRAPSF